MSNFIIPCHSASSSFPVELTDHVMSCHSVSDIMSDVCSETTAVVTVSSSR